MHFYNLQAIVSLSHSHVNLTLYRRGIVVVTFICLGLNTTSNEEIIFNNSEASELLKIFPLYYEHSDIFERFKTLTTQKQHVFL